MNYYEELGIRPDADEEEIRKAHRRLVKLMHPDQHRDQGLKQLAETQMRRLNSIVATLLDPDQREEYDEQLKGGGGENGAGPAPPTGGWRSIPWWIASTLVAIVLTVAAVWFWADRYGTGPKGSNPVEVGPEGRNPSAQAETGGQAPTKPDETVVKVGPNPAPESNPSEQSKATAPPTQASTRPPVPPAPLGTEQHKNPPVESVKTEAPPAVKPKEIPPPPPVAKPAQQQTAAVKNPPATTAKPPSPQAAVQTVVKQVPHQVAPPPVIQTAKASLPEAVPNAHRRFDEHLLQNQGASGNRQARGGDINLPAPPPGATPSSRDEFPGIPSPTITLPKYPEPTKPLVDGHNRDPLEGEWVYAPAEPEKRRPGFYPPESIILKLTKQADGMHGQYSARYIIADAKPVSPDVSFSMRALDKTARKYAWTAADGSRGVAEIRSVEADTMRIEWKLTNQKGNGQVLSSGIATLIRRN